MSVRAMSWALDLSLAGQPMAKFVLVVLCDHADNDGRNIYPAVNTVARKTDLSERSVQRAMRWLVEHGLLIPDGVQRVPHGAVRRYRVDMTQRVATTLTGDTQSPVESARGDTQSPQGVTHSRVRGDCVSPKPSLTINKPSTDPTAGADRAGSPPDADGQNGAPADSSEGGTMTILNSTKRLDPIEHQFNVVVASDRNERLLRRGRGSETAKDFAIEFYRATNAHVVRAAEWLSGAEQLYEACGGDWSVAAEAIKRLRAGKVTISSPHSAVRTAAAIRGERASKPAAEVGVVYVPVFN